MAEAKSVWFDYKRTFNLGNFESVTISAGVSMSIDSVNEDPEHVLDFAAEMCKDAIKRNVPPNYRPTPTVQTQHKISGIEVVD